MANLLFKQGSFKVLHDDLETLAPEETNKLIKIAGTTCYQTRESTKKTPEEFIQMLYNRGHLSVLEHSWFCYGIKLNNRSKTKIKMVGYDFYKANNLFSITDKDNRLIVSGNARMFCEGFGKADFPELNSIMFDLCRENRNLFVVHKLPIPSLGLKEAIERNPMLKFREEKLAHTAMCVEFNNHCRGFTHEHVRHRLASFSQESTRYVDYSKGDVNLNEFQMQFILPYNDKFDFSQKIEFNLNGENRKMSPAEFTNVIEAFYRAVRKAGLKPEEARQWLPIGLKSQIVTTANLKEWRHWFYMRTAKFAHPEIRWTALKLLKFCKKRWPDLFDDFQIAEDEKSAVIV